MVSRMLRLTNYLAVSLIRDLGDHHDEMMIMKCTAVDFDTPHSFNSDIRPLPGKQMKVDLFPFVDLCIFYTTASSFVLRALHDTLTCKHTHIDHRLDVRPSPLQHIIDSKYYHHTT